ncbi:tetratricopeptide repeat protein, partial [uncultured Psychrobacter sp.]|uniref:tetratricopeptide repeat protein n=1 Tax=uncultured Psychrobacter sp. TaxID=259303 RepID=UPI0034162F18
MNIDDMEGLDDATKTQITAWQKITREKDGGDTFAKAQFNIGSVYHENNKLENALKAWNKIKRSDNPELYAQLRLDIGVMFKQGNDDKRALIEWSKVKRSDSPVAYAYAQFYTGRVLYKSNNFLKSKEAYKNIKRADNLELFIEAQFRIAEILLLEGDPKGAISSWSNIERSDDQAAYAKAQFSIGSILLERKIDKELALIAWNNIKKTDDPKIFADAQFGIGYELDNKKDIDGALEVWSQILRSDNPEVYAKAQFNIGAILRKQNNSEGALSAWRNVARSDDAESYAKAKFSIGVILNEENETDEALIEWLSINFADDNKMFAQAQFNIGCELSDQGDFKGALLAWSNIERSADSDIYAKVKVKSGFLFKKRKDINGAITEWSKVQRIDNAEAYAVAQANIGQLSLDTPTVAKKSFLNIRKSDNTRIYAYAQFKLGLIFINEDNIEEAVNSFSTAKSYYPYESYCCEKICDLLKVSETKNFGLILLQLLNIVLDIVDILTLDFSKYADEEKPFERKLAHYTSTYTSNLLLGNDKNNTRPSSFRLNTINNVNDPSEGQLLIRKLKGVKDNSFTALDFNKEFHAFISCFTFNHDSLNQFRLYGKQDNKEASGMSLVFKKEFFQPTNFIGGLSYLSIENTSKIIENISTINDMKIDNIEMKASDDEKIVKHSVMRCVYLDPISDYFHLAQRNRLTFFREFGDRKIIKNGMPVSQAEYEWSLYKSYTEVISENFKEAYNKLKYYYKEVASEINNLSYGNIYLEQQKKKQEANV